jgi:RNA polymerase primary sigma factor
MTQILTHSNADNADNAAAGQTEVVEVAAASAPVPASVPAVAPVPVPAPASAPAVPAETQEGGSTQLDPAVIKLIEYAKEKKSLSYEELQDYLPEHIANSDKIEEVLALLEANNVQLIEEDASGEDEAESEVRKEANAEKKRLVYNDKESSVDDPIRLYLREIGRENLLTAEQEVELSKSMEDGENIIKGVIKKSGMIIPEFYHIAQKAFSKKDFKELSLSKKEITEHMTERRRLNQFYKETLRLVLTDLKSYTEVKKRLISRGVNIFEDPELNEIRAGS